MLPFDLHVLGLPPAFTLSQDQTLHLKTHSPRTKNLKLQMLDRWQRFACFKTIDMLLDQTSARWTIILPAGAFTRYLRILSKNLGVGLSAFLRVPRRFRRCEPPIIADFSASSTPFFEVFCVSTDGRYLPGGGSRPLVVMPEMPEGLSSLRAAYYVRLFESVNNL